MVKTFLVSTAGGRIDGFIKLINSLKRYAASGWGIRVLFQKYSDEDFEKAESSLKEIFGENYSTDRSDELTGGHLSRVYLLDKYDSDIWMLLDDDMEALPFYTNYDMMSAIVQKDKSIGLISGNWRRTEGMCKKVQKVNKILKQDIVYTGGGLCFRNDVAEIIKAIPRKMYLFDNPLWSIYVYVAGYTNCRYMGSVAVHNICTKGGRRRWLSEVSEEKSLPPSEYITTHKGKGKAGSNDEYLICDSSDITDFAKELHRRNKK